MASNRRVLLPGKTVQPWGKIGAVMLTGGERYYMLIDRHGVVSLMPADVVEPAAEGQTKRKVKR